MKNQAESHLEYAMALTSLLVKRTFRKVARPGHTSRSNSEECSFCEVSLLYTLNTRGPAAYKAYADICLRFMLWTCHVYFTYKNTF